MAYHLGWIGILKSVKVFLKFTAASAAAKSLQSCPTLCDPIDSSPPGSPIPGILQARILEWVAISFSNAWRWKVKVKSLSPVGLWVTPWTAAYRAPPSMGSSRQEYWSGVPSPSLLKFTKNAQVIFLFLNSLGFSVQVFFDHNSAIIQMICLSFIFKDNIIQHFVYDFWKLSRGCFWMPL